MNLFAFIKANNFFPVFCPDVKNWKAKMRGKNTRGTPLEFSDEDQKNIITGIMAMSAGARENILKDPAGTLSPNLSTE